MTSLTVNKMSVSNPALTLVITNAKQVKTHLNQLIWSLQLSHLLSHYTCMLVMLTYAQKIWKFCIHLFLSLSKSIQTNIFVQQNVTISSQTQFFHNLAYFLNRIKKDRILPTENWLDLDPYQNLQFISSKTAGTHWLKVKWFWWRKKRKLWCRKDTFLVLYTIRKCYTFF